MKRIALVTGANRGLGRKVAHELARLGHTVWLTARNEEAGNKAAESMKAEGLDVRFRHVDLAWPGSIGQAATEIGQVDILVNNGAILEKGDTLSVDHDALERSIRINLLGAIHCIRAFAPGMIERDWGRIVNVSSGSGSFGEGMEGPMIYSVTKAGVNAVTRSAANHFPDSVKVNAVCPGWVKTDMGGDNATRSLEKGARSILWAANLPDDGPTGGFFRDGKAIDW